jgi:hypothetical protein
MLVAAKSLRKEALDSEREELLEEALVMAQMDHQNVVRLIGVVTRGRPIYVVLGMLGSVRLPRIPV